MLNIGHYAPLKFMSESLPISPHKSAKNPHEHKGYHADFPFFEQTFSKSLVFFFFYCKGELSARYNTHFIGCLLCIKIRVY